MKWLQRLIMVSMLMTPCGCGLIDWLMPGLEDKFDQAIKQLDTMNKSLQQGIAAMNGASKDWLGESKKWQDTLGKLQKDFALANEKLLGETLVNASNRVILQTNTVALCDVAYMEVKFKDQLKFISAAIDNAKRELAEAKKTGDKSRIQVILDAVSNTKVWDDPFIIAFTPPNISFDWDDWHKTKFRFSSQLASARMVQIFGWGFDRPPGETLKLNVSVRGSDGRERPVHTASIVNGGNFQQTINFTDRVNDFRPYDVAFVVECGNGPNNKREFAIGFNTLANDEGPKHKAWAERMKVRNGTYPGKLIVGRPGSPHSDSMAAIGLNDHIVGVGGFCGVGANNLAFVVRHANGTAEKRPTQFGLGNQAPSHAYNYWDVPPGDFIEAYKCEHGDMTDSWTFVTHNGTKLRVGGHGHPQTSETGTVDFVGGPNSGPAPIDGKPIAYELVGGDITYGQTVDTFRGVFRPHFTPDELREPALPE